MFERRREKSNLSLNDTELLKRAQYLFAALDMANITNALFRSSEVLFESVGSLFEPI